MKSNSNKAGNSSLEIISSAISFLCVIFLFLYLFFNIKILGVLGFLMLGCENLYIVISNHKNKTKSSMDIFYLIMAILGFILCISTFNK